MIWKWKRLFLSFILLQVPCSSPINPLTMRMLSSTPPTSMACPSPSMQSQQQQQQGGASTRAWEREPPLLSEQYETLSDSDDWGRSSPPSSTQASTPHSCSPSPVFRCLYESHSLPLRVRFCWEGGRTCGATCGATLVPIGGQREHCREPLIFRIKSDAFFFAHLGMRNRQIPSE